MNDQTTREQYLPHRKAKELLGISDTTLRRWAKEGRIEFTTTVTGHKRYKVSSAQSKTQKTSRQKVCYCRVSTKKQDQDLDNQVSYLTKQFPEHTIIKDIGSGLNWKRKGLITLLDLVTNGEIQEVVVAHRDRLARFGTELIQYIFDKHQVKGGNKIYQCKKCDLSIDRDINGSRNIMLKYLDESSNWDWFLG